MNLLSTRPLSQLSGNQPNACNQEHRIPSTVKNLFPQGHSNATILLTCANLLPPTSLFCHLKGKRGVGVVLGSVYNIDMQTTGVEYQRRGGSYEREGRGDIGAWIHFLLLLCLALCRYGFVSEAAEI